VTRGRPPTAAGAELASAVLTDLAAGLAHAAIAERHSVTRQRVSQIAAAAGVETRARGGGSPSHREGAALLARVRELAAAAGEEPGDWLDDATAAIAACARIVEIVDGEGMRLLRSDRHVSEIKALAIGRNPPALAAQVRAVVDAVTEP
jgi:hypothetical protein